MPSLAHTSLNSEPGSRTFISNKPKLIKQGFDGWVSPHTLLTRVERAWLVCPCIKLTSRNPTSRWSLSASEGARASDTNARGCTFGMSLQQFLRRLQAMVLLELPMTRIACMHLDPVLSMLHVSIVLRAVLPLVLQLMQVPIFRVPATPLLVRIPTRAVQIQTPIRLIQQPTCVVLLAKLAQLHPTSI
jgi:hypothetical protein